MLLLVLNMIRREEMLTAALATIRADTEMLVLMHAMIGFGGERARAFGALVFAFVCALVMALAWIVGVEFFAAAVFAGVFGQFAAFGQECFTAFDVFRAGEVVLEGVFGSVDEDPIRIA